MIELLLWKIQVCYIQPWVYTTMLYTIVCVHKTVCVYNYVICNFVYTIVYIYV